MNKLIIDENLLKDKNYIKGLRDSISLVRDKYLKISEDSKEIYESREILITVLESVTGYLVKEIDEIEKS